MSGSKDSPSNQEGLLEDLLTVPPRADRERQTADWDNVSDAELATAAAAGDPGAFAGIYRRYADRLESYCAGMLADHDAAADCVGDVFCDAAQDLPRLREPAKLRSWLYAMAKHQALRRIRDRRRMEVSDDVPDVPSQQASPSSYFRRAELANVIAQAALGLSERDRTVLELAYRHGLDGPELAKALGVSLTHANTLAYRLRETIQHCLAAMLVARAAQHNPTACRELGVVLGGWDGQFSVLMRKRIARHINSCNACEQSRLRLMNQVALLGAVPGSSGRPLATDIFLNRAARPSSPAP